MKQMSDKNKEMKRIRELFFKAWGKKIKSFATTGLAIKAGYSYAAIADELKVTRARVANQFNGQANMGMTLMMHLHERLGIAESEMMIMLPEKKPTRNYVKHEKEAGEEMVIIPNVALYSSESKDAWEFVKQELGGGNASQAIRLLILGHYREHGSNDMDRNKV